MSKITVNDPYSSIKMIIKNILMNRCGVKPEELTQYCQFNLPKPQLGDDCDKSESHETPKKKNLEDIQQLV